MKRQIRRGFIAALAAGAFVSLGSSVLGGVTGDVTGVVKDQTGAPVAGAKVEALAPSMTRTATTDAGGHFVILSLAPDTYTISLSRAGYESISFPGVTVFADQTQALTYTMLKALRAIAHVTSGNNSLVKPGIGIDVYSVNASQVAAAAVLGGPGDLNNACHPTWPSLSAFRARAFQSPSRRFIYAQTRCWQKAIRRPTRRE
jgi:hypothetical protein